MIGALLGATHFLCLTCHSESAGFGVDSHALGYQTTGYRCSSTPARELGKPVAATTMEAR
jgi:hypothetical protein